MMSEQFAALEIVLCSVLWLMPLFKLMVGPPHEAGVGEGVGGGVGAGVPDELTESELFAVTGI
jgi:hypothetical protein